MRKSIKYYSIYIYIYFKYKQIKKQMFGCCIKQHVDQINKYITSIKVTLKINYNYNKIKTDY